MRWRWAKRVIAASTRITVFWILNHIDLGTNDRIDRFVIGPTGLPAHERRKIVGTL